MIGRRLGPDVEAAFLDDMAGPPRVIESVMAPDRRRAAALVRDYADIGLGAADATLVAIAERLRLTTIATVDRRDFEIVRPRHVDRFLIVP